jgi:hypothetical protein
MVSRETSRRQATLRGLGRESFYAKVFHVKHRRWVPGNAILQNNPMHQKIVLLEQGLDLVHFRHVRDPSAHAVERESGRERS